MGLADRPYMQRNYGNPYPVSKAQYKPYYRPPRKTKSNRDLWDKIKYTKNKGIIIGMAWFVTLLFILPTLEGLYAKEISNISAIFFIASFVIGFYNAYPLTMWIDRRIPNTDFGIWMRRIVAGIMAAVGFGFALLIFISSMISTTELYFHGSKSIPAVSILSITVLFASFFIGIGAFASYMEFTHERRAGTIVHFGRTRY